MTRPWDRIERTTKVRVCAHRSARVGRLACSKMAIFWDRLQEGVKSAQREKCTLKEVKKKSTYGLGTQAHSRACLVLSARLSLSFLVSSHHLLLGHALLLLGPFDAPQLPVSTTGSKMTMSAHPPLHPQPKLECPSKVHPGPVFPAYGLGHLPLAAREQPCHLQQPNSQIEARSRRDTRARRERSADKHLFSGSNTRQNRHALGP
jgi:hypothetical protein